MHRLRMLGCFVLMLIGVASIGSTDGQAVSGSLSGNYEIHPIMALSGDGEVIALSGRFVEDETARMGIRYIIDLIDTTTNHRIWAWGGSEDGITGLAVNNDGTRIAYTNNTGKVAIVNVESETETVITSNFPSASTYPIWPPTRGEVAVNVGGAVIIFQEQSPRRVATLANENTSHILTSDWSDDGRVIAYSAIKHEEGHGLLILNTLSDDLEQVTSQAIELEPVTTLALSSDGEHIAMGVADGILIMNIDDYSQFLLPKIEETDATFDLDWSHDGNRIVIGGKNHIVIWDVFNQQVASVIETHDYVTSLEWSYDDQLIYYAGPDGLYQVQVSDHMLSDTNIQSDEAD